MNKFEHLKTLDIDKAVDFLFEFFTFDCDKCPNFDELSGDCCVNAHCRDSVKELLSEQYNPMPELKPGMIFTYRDIKEYTCIVTDNNWCYKVANNYNISIDAIKRFINNVYIVQPDGSKKKIWSA